jgi:hypothetical protein
MWFDEFGGITICGEPRLARCGFFGGFGSLILRVPSMAVWPIATRLSVTRCRRITKGKAADSARAAMRSSP